MAEPSAVERMPPAAPSERMQRLRVGITGLAAVVIIVLLAAAIATQLKRTAAVNQNAGVALAPPPAANAADPNAEPLAQLGVAPGASGEKSRDSAKAKR